MGSESRFWLGFCEWLSSNKYGAKGPILGGLGGLGAYPPPLPQPENVAKLKRFWCIFREFQPLNFMYQVDLIIRRLLCENLR